MGFQFGQYIMINRTFWPCLVLNCRHCGFYRFYKGPVFFIFGTGFNPFMKNLLFLVLLDAMAFGNFIGMLRFSMAFTPPPSKSTARPLPEGFCLGPMVRNGMGYDDVKLGTGRREIVPDIF